MSALVPTRFFFVFLYTSLYICIYLYAYISFCNSLLTRACDAKHYFWGCCERSVCKCMYMSCLFWFCMFDYKVSTLTTILCVDIREISQSSHHFSQGSKNKRGFLVKKVLIKLLSFGIPFFPDWKKKMKLLSQVFFC